MNDKPAKVYCDGKSGKYPWWAACCEWTGTECVAKDTGDDATPEDATPPVHAATPSKEEEETTEDAQPEDETPPVHAATPSKEEEETTEDAQPEHETPPEDAPSQAEEEIPANR